MSMSTTAQDLGGILMFFFRDTDALDGVWYSAVSAMTSLFCVNWLLSKKYQYNFVLRNLYLGLWVFLNVCRL